jgi:hypothetical protein
MKNWSFYSKKSPILLKKLPISYEKKIKKINNLYMKTPHFPIKNGYENDDRCSGNLQRAIGA